MDRRLLHCPIVCELWSLVFCLFGIHWVMLHKVIESFESWQGRFGRHHKIDFWRLVLHCLMWCIWRERNAKSFGGCEHSTLEIKSFFLQTLLEWSLCGCLIFLVFPFLFYLIVVILVPDLCPHNTSPTYSDWLFFKNMLCYLSKKEKGGDRLQLLYLAMSIYLAMRNNSGTNSFNGMSPHQRSPISLLQKL